MEKDTTAKAFEKRLGDIEYKEAIGERLLPMRHDDSRPSHLLVGLIEESELRELLDEVYLYAL